MDDHPALSLSLFFSAFPLKLMYGIVCASLTIFTRWIRDEPATPQSPRFEARVARWIREFWSAHSRRLGDLAGCLSHPGGYEPLVLLAIASSSLKITRLVGFGIGTNVRAPSALNATMDLPQSTHNRPPYYSPPPAQVIGTAHGSGPVLLLPSAFSVAETRHPTQTTLLRQLHNPLSPVFAHPTWCGSAFRSGLRCHSVPSGEPGRSLLGHGIQTPVSPALETAKDFVFGIQFVTWQPQLLSSMSHQIFHGQVKLRSQGQSYSFPVLYVYKDGLPHLGQLQEEPLKQDIGHASAIDVYETTPMPNPHLQVTVPDTFANRWSLRQTL
ncbi:hypothetical protein B0T20DRAFT_391064 [Sordaria brevicollis]|uniref:Uncharacterized protein n=1 Tax=Sordaria brevicollis TaxID=83679 RepID=A0AAE0PJY7_SORBR|nr:hypothetical protein B0T20DRAFT_391064 [Sordaria brevicollis]